jgi:hypothetical protein
MKGLEMLINEDVLQENGWSYGDAVYFFDWIRTNFTNWRINNDGKVETSLKNALTNVHTFVGRTQHEQAMLLVWTQLLEELKDAVSEDTKA